LISVCRRIVSHSFRRIFLRASSARFCVESTRGGRCMATTVIKFRHPQHRRREHGIDSRGFRAATITHPSDPRGFAANAGRQAGGDGITRPARSGNNNNNNPAYHRERRRQQRQFNTARVRITTRTVPRQSSGQRNGGQAGNHGVAARMCFRPSRRKKPGQTQRTGQSDAEIKMIGGHQNFGITTVSTTGTSPATEIRRRPRGSPCNNNNAGNNGNTPARDRRQRAA